MAAPVISNVVGIPGVPVAPGTPVDLTVVVSDVDTRDVVLQIVATDAEGNSSAPTSVTLQIVDNVTAAATVVSGGGALAQTGALSFRYIP